MFNLLVDCFLINKTWEFNNGNFRLKFLLFVFESKRFCWHAVLSKQIIMTWLKWMKECVNEIPLPCFLLLFLSAKYFYNFHRLQGSEGYTIRIWIYIYIFLFSIPIFNFFFHSKGFIFPVVTLFIFLLSNSLKFFCQSVWIFVWSINHIKNYRMSHVLDLIFI